MYSVLYVMVILYYVQCTVCDGYIMCSVLYVMVILYYVQCYIILCTVYCM